MSPSVCESRLTPLWRRANREELYHNSERIEKPIPPVGTAHSCERPTFADHQESRSLQVYSDVGSSTPSVGEVSRSSGSVSDSADSTSSEYAPKVTDPLLRKREIEARLREIDSTERQLRIEDHSGQMDRVLYRRDGTRHSVIRSRRSPSDSPDFEARLHRIRANHRSSRY
ncbi:unnamed protein product [Echinostoma caproni]|uniref:Similar to n=1 Tax=Echinostoma caproni TaxID=27848 RepID=A0A183AUQ6_9TREM|nr:unnamed protein product [Echinostoma caproni]